MNNQTMNNQTTTTQTTRALTPTPRLHRSRWLLNLATMSAAAVVWTLAVPLAGVDLTVGSGGNRLEVTLSLVISVSLLAGSAAWGSLTLLEQVSPHATRIWTWLATGVLLVSLLGPLGADSAAATGVLALLHVVVGGALIVGMPRVGQARRRTTVG